MKKNRFAGILVGIFLVIFAGLSIGSSLHESLTYDEIVHTLEGKNALIQHTFLIDTYNPPLVRELAALPFVLGAGKFIHSPYPNIQAFPARLMIIVLGLAICAGVFWVAKYYFGTSIGLFSLLLYIFEPNILANSHYVTLDIGGALFFFLAYITFVRALTKPTGKNWIIFGIASGCMAASKITSLPFFALSAVFASFYMFGKKTVSWFWNKKMWAIIVMVTALLVLWATYFFKLDVVIVPSITRGRLSERLFQTASKQGNHLVTIGIRLLQTKPIPLGNYVAVIKNTVLYARQPKKVFFWGEFYGYSRWYYILVNALVKFSIPLFILFITGILFGLQDKKIRKSIIILLIPVISILVLASFGHMLPWMRYLLPMIPFVVMIAASSIRYVKNNWMIFLLLVLLVWHIVGTLSFYPNFLAYTNEFVNRKTSYEKLMDSNLEWGESLITFAQYVGRAKPPSIRFSYFGRDDGNGYGLPSNFSYGSYKEDQICAFHEIKFPNNTGSSFTAISVSNWYYCGYYHDPKYSKAKIKSVVGNAILIY